MLGSPSQQILADHAEPEGGKRQQTNGQNFPLAEWNDTYDTHRMWTQIVVRALYYWRIQKMERSFYTWILTNAKLLSQAVVRKNYRPGYHIALEYNC